MHGAKSSLSIPEVKKSHWVTILPDKLITDSDSLFRFIKILVHWRESEVIGLSRKNLAVMRPIQSPWQRNLERQEKSWRHNTSWFQAIL